MELVIPAYVRLNAICGIRNCIQVYQASERMQNCCSVSCVGINKYASIHSTAECCDAIETKPPQPEPLNL